MEGNNEKGNKEQENKTKEVIKRDDRKALPVGTILCGNNIEYEIQKECGRGFHCIVYDAVEIKKKGETSKVRIKECCPFGGFMEREQDGALNCHEAVSFYKEKDLFEQAFYREQQMSQEENFGNSIDTANDKWNQNNTIYTVSDCTGGMNYNSWESKDVFHSLWYGKRLAEIVKEYHKRGLLHLNITPETIWIPLTEPYSLKLFNNDFAVKKQEVIAEKRVNYSGYSSFFAPEFVNGEKKLVSEKTDIFSIGAVMFYKIMGKRARVIDCSAVAAYDFKHGRLAYTLYPLEFYTALSRFFHRTLASSVGMRYHSVDEVLEGLAELMVLSEKVETREGRL